MVFFPVKLVVNQLYLNAWTSWIKSNETIALCGRTLLFVPTVISNLNWQNLKRNCCTNLMLLTLGGSLKLISHDMKIHTTFMTFINDLSTLVRKAVLVWKTITLQIIESSNIDHKYMYEYIRSRSPLLLNDKKIELTYGLIYLYTFHVAFWF